MIQHPVSQRSAAAFHLGFVAAYALAILFHGLSAWNHWRERE